MLDRIPQELLIQILVKLPVEDLLRCLSVCKSWYSLVSSPYFISVHAKPPSVSSSNDLLIVKYGFQASSYSLHFDNDTFDIYKRLNLPVYERHCYFRVIGCFNGVLCLSDDRSIMNLCTILWNPSIRKVVTLPMPIVTFGSHGLFDLAVGFSFCPVKNDYKLVRVVYVEPGDGNFKLPPEVEIFELSIGSWRQVDPKGFSYLIDFRKPQAFLNGAVHWVGSKQWLPNVIVSFHMEREEFGVIELPEGPAGQDRPRCFYVAVLGGYLSLIQNTDSGDGMIWVMEQYGVSETWKIYCTLEVAREMEMFGFRKSGDILMSMTAATASFCRDFLHADLLSCDLKTKQLKYLNVGGQKVSLYVDAFVESLALLGARDFKEEYYNKAFCCFEEYYNERAKRQEQIQRQLQMQFSPPLGSQQLQGRQLASGSMQHGIGQSQLNQGAQLNRHLNQFSGAANSALFNATQGTPNNQMIPNMSGTMSSQSLLPRMQVIEMYVHMHCAGCESKVRKYLLRLKGVDEVDIDMAAQKVTVTGWADQKKVLKRVRKTGKREELWQLPHDPQYMNLNNLQC